jgi:hypothetical protein
MIFVVVWEMLPLYPAGALPPLNLCTGKHVLIMRKATCIFVVHLVMKAELSMPKLVLFSSFLISFVSLSFFFLVNCLSRLKGSLTHSLTPVNKEAKTFSMIMGRENESAM